jgi:hypothetical protein
LCWASSASSTVTPRECERWPSSERGRVFSPRSA